MRGSLVYLMHCHSIRSMLEKHAFYHTSISEVSTSVDILKSVSSQKLILYRKKSVIALKLKLFLLRQWEKEGEAREWNSDGKVEGDLRGWMRAFSCHRHYWDLGQWTSNQWPATRPVQPAGPTAFPVPTQLQPYLCQVSTQHKKSWNVHFLWRISSWRMGSGSDRRQPPCHGLASGKIVIYFKSSCLQRKFLCFFFRRTQHVHNPLSSNPRNGQNYTYLL